MQRYFFGKLVFRTTHRDGVAMNMTIKELNRAKWDTVKNNIASKCVHTELIRNMDLLRSVPKELYQQMGVLNAVHLQMGTENEYVFIPWKENKQMLSGQCSKGISKCFQNENILNKSVKVTCKHCVMLS